MILQIFGFDQERITGTGLDMVDMMILYYVIFVSSSADMLHEIDEEKRVYTWINHKKFKEDLPFLELAEPTLKKRLAKLKDLGMLQTVVIHNEMKGKRTYYGITAYCDSLRKSKMEDGYKISNDQVSQNILGNDQVSQNILDTPSPSIPKYPSDNHTTINNQNISKETKAKKSLVEQVMDEYPAFLENSDLRQTYLDFAEMRKNKKKPLSTERMIRLSINRVIDRGNGDVTKMIGLLEEAIEGCWDKVWSEEDKNKTSVYPAKKIPKNEGTKDWDNMLNALEEGRLNSAESLSNTGNVVAIPANTKDTVDILDLFKDEGEIIL